MHWLPEPVDQSSATEALPSLWRDIDAHTSPEGVICDASLSPTTMSIR
jgi:hypothetical protein